MGSRINEFRRKIAFGQYELTGHAKEEMEQDGFTIADVKNAIYSGRIAEAQRHGRECRKFVVSGKATDRRAINLVCRLTESGTLRIITVFAK